MEAEASQRHPREAWSVGDDRLHPDRAAGRHHHHRHSGGDRSSDLPEPAFSALRRSDQERHDDQLAAFQETVSPATATTARSATIDDGRASHSFQGVTSRRSSSLRPQWLLPRGASTRRTSRTWYYDSQAGGIQAEGSPGVRSPPAELPAAASTRLTLARLDDVRGPACWSPQVTPGSCRYDGMGERPKECSVITRLRRLWRQRGAPTASR